MRFQGEKSVLEERLAQEVARVRQVKSERTHLEAEKSMLEAQLAAKQDTVEDLMAEFAEALMRADDYEKFGPSSALMKPPS